VNTPHRRGTADPGGISGTGPGPGAGSGPGPGPGTGSGSGSGTGTAGAFRILHVSTGNVCRSPLTERLTRHALEERLGDGRCGGIVVESAGTWGHAGAPMEEHAAEVLLEHGADPDGFRGRELLDEHVIRADLVLTATRDHRAQVVSMGHSAGLRTFTLKEFTRLVRAIDAATLPDPRSAEGVVERAHALVQAAAALRGWLLAPSPEADEIHDPYGAPIPYFRSVGDEISKALDPVATALTGVPAHSRPHT
jgi:low molecular weight protein-tyrosine phosphatase